jgi:hypothetical protein
MHRRLRLVVLALGVCAACNSDDPIFDSQSSSSDPPATTTTGPVPTTTGSSSTTSDDTTSSSSSSSSSSSGDGETTEAPPEKTCRDVLECVGMCAIMFDLACFQMCAEGVPPEEGAEALALGGCILQSCFTSGKCSPDTLMDIACLGCIGLGFLGGTPDGCEAEAEACM